MNSTQLTPSDFVRQPWKNGGGITTELAVEAEGDRWLWRLSLAEVTRSGPFSDFRGYDRILLLVEGKGMELTIDDATSVTLETPYEPFMFDGAARVACRLLDGPVKDLNVIVDRRRATGAVEVVAAARSRSKTLQSHCVLAYALRGTTAVRAGSYEGVLGAGELLRIDRARTSLELTALDHEALLALVRVDLK